MRFYEGLFQCTYATIVKVGGANTESKNSRDSSICLKTILTNLFHQKQS